ncbi:MAG: D-alanyl-lipoteichoic acid biosynthesis protein DltD [Verrucomicrobiota bacterium]
MQTGSPSRHFHLRAASLALAIAGIALAVSLLWCARLERRYIHALAPEFIPEKLQGAVLQQHAFAQPDLLVLYGSSELVKEMPNNATQFFQDYPTGFRVFPVGKPGTASLSVLQKVAAVGEHIRGRKVAYSISPGWFFTEFFDPQYYEGNFSNMQAFELAFSKRLSWNLKRDIAHRMLDYPNTLDERPLLNFTLWRLAGDTVVDRAFYGATWPLGRLYCGVGRMQDHFEAALHILEVDEKLNPTPVRGLGVMKWSELLKRAAKLANAAAVVQKKKDEVKKKRLPRASRDKTLLPGTAREWTDLELLLRVFKELEAEPLLLAMPIEDIRLEVAGLSPSPREAYVKRLNALAKQYQVPLADFREHQKDNDFLVDFLDHLSAEGWMYYNKALDDFYHGRFINP